MLGSLFVAAVLIDNGIVTLRLSIFMPRIVRSLHERVFTVAWPHFSSLVATLMLLSVLCVYFSRVFVVVLSRN